MLRWWTKVGVKNIVRFLTARGLKPHYHLINWKRKQSLIISYPFEKWHILPDKQCFASLWNRYFPACTDFLLANLTSHLGRKKAFCISAWKVASPPHGALEMLPCPLIVITVDEVSKGFPWAICTKPNTSLLQIGKFLLRWRNSYLNSYLWLCKQPTASVSGYQECSVEILQAWERLASCILIFFLLSVYSYLFIS